MKKVLSIVLSIVMVLCMMPAMAFAGTADFTDAADINHGAAVDTLAALAILEGYPDGSFQPAKVVTRAEMAKIIATVLNGGEAPVLSTTTTSYTDTKGHWAAGYVEYCTSLGIVEGVGAGAFAPDAPVTAEAAAKMVLVAQGYNAAVEGMTGAQWASNTNVLANQNGYYTELKDIETGAGASREHVAQMIFNALDAFVVTKTDTVDKATGAVSTHYSKSATTTVAEKCLGLDYIVDGTITNITYDKKDGYTYTLSGAKKDGDAVTSVKTTADYTDLFQMKVKILSKEVKGKTVVYGMFADECSVVYEGVFGDIDANTLDTAADTIKIAGTTYDLEDGVTLETANAAEFGATPVENLMVYSPVKVIDADNDGEIDKLVYSPVKVAKVEFAGNTEFKVEDGTYVKYTDEHTSVYDGIAKGDYVAITKDIVGTKTVYTKLDTLKNVKVDVTKGMEATIGGTVYKMSAENQVVAGGEYDVVALLNGYIVRTEYDANKVDLSKYALLTGKMKQDSFSGEKTLVQLLSTNGEVVEATLASTDYLPEAGTIVKYSVDSNGKYTLEQAQSVGNNFVGHTAVNGKALNFIAKDKENAATIEVKTSEAASKYAIESDAVVFVTTSTANGPKYSVITGAELAAKTDVPTVKQIFTKVNTSTGYTKVAMASVSNIDTTAKTYAIVTGTTSVAKNAAGKYQYGVQLSTSPDAFYTAYITGTDKYTDLNKGDIVEYTLNAAGELTDVTVKDLTAQAITAYDVADPNNMVLELDGAAKLVEKSTVIYVDSKDMTVREGGSIAMAQVKNNTAVDNVKAIVNDKDEIQLLVVDVYNAWYVAPVTPTVG